MAGWAVLSCGASLAWKALLAVAAAYVCWMDWRCRARCETLTFDRHVVCAQLASGRVLFTQAPFTARIAPGFVSIRFRTRWRDRWLTLFHDQLPPDIMRRLRRTLLHGTHE